MNFLSALISRSRILTLILILALPLLPSLVLRCVRSLRSSPNVVASSSSAASRVQHLRTAAMPYDKELLVAQLAVQRAAQLTKRVFHEQAKGTQSKADKSPVTFGDYGAQALIIYALRANFPDDEVIGEEDAADLRQENNELGKKVWQMVRETSLQDGEAERTLGGPIPSEEAMLDAIDGGASQGGRKGRVWALDPIDGTLGFLRGGQYAVCLALLVDGVPTVGVLGCPNLPIDDNKPLDAQSGMDATDAEDYGVLFSAVAGQGATSRPLAGGGVEQAGRSIQMRQLGESDLATATFCESVEAGHSNHSQQAEIATALGITRPSVRMDSQAKYASIARGAGDIYLRLPKSKSYVEKIWDHAAGDLIVREAGGMVTDVNGKRLDFGLGQTLKENQGVVAAPKDIHPTVLAAVRKAMEGS